MTLPQILEAMLFASSRPLSIHEMVVALRGATEFTEDPAVVELAQSKEKTIYQTLLRLQAQYRDQERAFALHENATGWQLMTLPIFAPWIRQLQPTDQKIVRLSPAALETLSLVAYRQPILRADIESVRGVDAGGVLQTLLDRGLIKIIDRAIEIPGRPLRYGTTDFFLEHFGLQNLDELPNCDELRKVPLPVEVSAESPVEAAGGKTDGA